MRTAVSSLLKDGFTSVVRSPAASAWRRLVTAEREEDILPASGMITAAATARSSTASSIDRKMELYTESMNSLFGASISSAQLVPGMGE